MYRFQLLGERFFGFVCLFKSSVLKDSFGPKHLLLFTIEPLFQESFVWTASKGLWVGHEDRVDHRCLGLSSAFKFFLQCNAHVFVHNV